MIEKLKSKQSGIVVYGITPPKRDTDASKLEGIAARQIDRLASLPLDGLVVYDIQDEGSRISQTRPFPFMETLDGFEYCESYLAGLRIPKVVYRSVGKYSREQLADFLCASPDEYLTVFVGAPSQQEKVSLSIKDAYAIKKKSDSKMMLGGVTIPERHRAKGDEHRRLEFKHSAGCRFFISQGVYDLDAAKNLLSDYHYHCQEKKTVPDPILFTFTPCGSKKTLAFMKWLGISIPRWLENELIHSADILQSSLEMCEQNWRALKNFAEEKGLPIGANIESVAIRKVEIEASVELVRRIASA